MMNKLILLRCLDHPTSKHTTTTTTLTTAGDQHVIPQNSI